MKSVDVKSSTYIGFNKENNKEDHKFDAADHVTISKYKNIFGEGYTTNWSEEMFVIKKVTKAVPWHMLLVIFLVKKLLKHFTKKNCTKQVKN